MSSASVRAHLSLFAADSRIRTLPETTSTVELAARAIGVEPARIAKTLALRIRGDEKPLILVAKGSARLDNAKFKAEFAAKPVFVPKEECAALTGHPPGGVCPFGLPDGMPVYLDRSLKEFDRLYPAAGAVNNYVDATPDEIAIWTRGKWVDVCV